MQNNENIKFYPVYEMIMMMERIFDEDECLRYFLGRNYRSRSNVIEIYNACREKISRHLYRDLALLMDKEFPILKLLISLIKDVRLLEDINLFLEWLEEQEVVVFLQDAYEQRKHTIKKVKYVDLEDLLYNEKEFKIRLQFVCKAFYENTFLEKQKDIKEERNQSLEEVQQQEARDKPILYSYFQEIGVREYDCFKAIGSCEALLEKQIQENKTKLMALKVLADDTRFQILRLLSHKPWYGAELAQQLQLSTATISYHLNALMEIKAIKIEKIRNKQYYSLDKDNIEGIIKGVLYQLL